MTPEQFSAVVREEAERMARGEFTSAIVERRVVETLIPDCDDPDAEPLVYRHTAP